MNYSHYLDSVADQFLETIRHFSVDEIPTEDFSLLVPDQHGLLWQNHRYESYLYRLAHVERYEDGKIKVLHVTTFPTVRDSAPIFGFDVIATESKVLGCYIDLSPVLHDWLGSLHLGHIFRNFDKHFQTRKPVPEWASDIFSNNVCFIEPQNDLEFCSFCLYGLIAYREYTKLLRIDKAHNLDTIAKIQNQYCEVQASNPRTFNVLKAKIGEEKARYFMEEILFPKIKK